MVPSLRQAARPSVGQLIPVRPQENVVASRASLIGREIVVELPLEPDRQQLCCLL
jgi:hypothetical protein